MNKAKLLLDYIKLEVLHPHPGRKTKLILEKRKKAGKYK